MRAPSACRPLRATCCAMPGRMARVRLMGRSVLRCQATVWFCCGFTHVRRLCAPNDLGAAPASDLWARFVTRSWLGLIRRAVEDRSASDLPPRRSIEVEVPVHSRSAAVLMMAPRPASASSTGSSSRCTSTTTIRPTSTPNTPITSSAAVHAKTVRARRATRLS